MSPFSYDLVNLIIKDIHTIFMQRLNGRTSILVAAFAFADGFKAHHGFLPRKAIINHLFNRIMFHPIYIHN